MYSKSELRYQLAAAVLLNTWIEDERRLGFVRRKKFYAFKQHIASLMKMGCRRKTPWRQIVGRGGGPIQGAYSLRAH